MSVTKYKAIIPFIDDMGSVNPIMTDDSSAYETKEEKVLWEINSMRDHDALPHLEELPEGVEFIVIDIED